VQGVRARLRAVVDHLDARPGQRSQKIASLEASLVTAFHQPDPSSNRHARICEVNCRLRLLCSLEWPRWLLGSPSSLSAYIAQKGHGAI
jgi:hypothetical protein